MPDKLFPIEQILSILAENPARIASLTADLSPAQLHTPPAPDEWSANDVLAHLRACGDVWGGHIKAILAEDTPTLKGINPRTWIKKTNYLELDFRSSFQSFTRQRADLLAVLELLPIESWSRAAKVMAWGQVNVPTVIHYADGLARHERSHVKQIASIAAALRM